MTGGGFELELAAVAGDKVVDAKTGGVKSEKQQNSAGHMGRVHGDSEYRRDYHFVKHLPEPAGCSGLLCIRNLFSLLS